MGLIVGLLTLPLAPVRGVAWVADQVRQEAERQWSDPVAIRAAMDEVQAGREAGSISDEEADRIEEELLDRLMAIERPPNDMTGSHG